jgi:acetyl esterase/lipase
MDLSKFIELEPQLRKIGGVTVMTLVPPDRSPDPEEPMEHVVFLHGGSYVMEAAFIHRSMARFLVRHGFRVSFVDYPLAPEHQASETVPATTAAYEALTTIFHRDTWCLLGDSAGGGLALALAQRLRDEKFAPRPARIALASPWADVSLANPALEGRTDLLITRDSLLLNGRRYAGDLPLDDPLVSPINGNLSDLGEFFVAYSEGEMIAPDCARLIDGLLQAGNRCVVYRTPGPLHDFMLAPGLPPARAARSALIEFLRDR